MKMNLRNSFLCLGLLLLPACSAITAPQPKQSEWPFGKSNHVAIFGTNKEKFGNNPDNAENRIDIYKGNQFDTYSYIERGDKPVSGKVWFKNDKSGQTLFAFSFPLTDDEVQKLDPNSEEARLAIYSRGKIIKSEKNWKAFVEILPCEPPIKDKNPKCEFATIKDGWWAAINAAQVQDPDGIVEFEINAID